MVFVALTMNVLAVTQDEAQATALEARFRRRLGSALTFEHLRSGTRALERLSRESADVVICARETEDVPGLTVLQRVRRDRDTAVVLLDRDALSQLLPSRFDAVLEATAEPADVLDAAYSLLAADGFFDDAARPFHGAFPGSSGRDVKVSGTLEGLTPFDLVLSLTQKRTSGRLYLLLGDVEAQLAFQQGRFVHAEYQQLTGEDAVIKLFLEAELHPNVEFFFEPCSMCLPPGGATLHTSVQEVLLKVALELDRHRLQAGQ